MKNKTIEHFPINHELFKIIQDKNDGEEDSDS